MSSNGVSAELVTRTFLWRSDCGQEETSRQEEVGKEDCQEGPEEEGRREVTDAPTILIDVPQPLAPLADWEAFRRSLDPLPQDDAEVKAAIAQADEAIAYLKAAR